MKNFKQFTIEATPFNIDILSGVLWELEIEGINEFDTYLTAFVYEDSELTVVRISDQLGKLVKEGLIESFNISEEVVENKNWNEEWEKNVNIIEVSEKVVIKPSFREYEAKPDQIIIQIDPKMSFGTGEHQTTKIMLKLAEKYVEDGQSVLDVGTGTGVIAIGSALLADTKMVLGIDNDEWCLLNGKENIGLNNLEDKVDIRLAEIADIKDENFDLIFANINKLVLLDIASELRKKIAESGTLLLSGLLLTDKEDIVSKYKNEGFTLIDEIELDEWKGLVFRLS